MRKLLFIFLLILPSWMVLAQDEEMPLHTIEHDGIDRTYRLFVPSVYDENSPLPLLIAFHPAGGDGTSMARLTALNEKAEVDNVIIAYPEGPLGYWDYGVGLPEWEVMGELYDDVGFFEALMNELRANYSISDVYVLGYSNGARMAFRIACEFGDQLAGVAAASATISEDIVNACPAERQVPILYIHGTEDETTPWEGESLEDGERIITYAWSAPNTVNFWVAQNGCDPNPEINDIEDQNPDDSITVRQVIFENCTSEMPVTFYAVLGGGHGWLGGEFNLQPSDYRPSGSATEYVWEFFGFAED